MLDLRTFGPILLFLSPDTLFPPYISLQELDRGPPRCGSHEALRALRPFDCSVTTRYSLFPVSAYADALTASRFSQPSLSVARTCPPSFLVYETPAEHRSRLCTTCLSSRKTKGATALILLHQRFRAFRYQRWGDGKSCRRNDLTHRGPHRRGLSYRDQRHPILLYFKRLHRCLPLPHSSHA